jgi:hypothetical protein
LGKVFGRKRGCFDFWTRVDFSGVCTSVVKC